MTLGQKKTLRFGTVRLERKTGLTRPMRAGALPSLTGASRSPVKNFLI